MLNGIVLTVVLVGLTAADAYVSRRWVIAEEAIFGALLAGLVAIGLWEFYRLAERAGARPHTGYGIACGILLVAAHWLWGRGAEAKAMLLPNQVVLLAGAALFGAVAVHVVRRGVEGAWRDLGATVLGLAYIWFPAAFLGRVRGMGLGPLILLVVTVKLSDVAAYVVGRAIGRRRLAPRVSPGKTVAGAVGALVVGTLAAAVFCLAWPGGAGKLTVEEAVLFGTVVTIFGILGDLGESVLKRAASVKDSGTLLPGFGGVLDVIDSLWGAAPAAYVILVLFGGTSGAAAG